MHSEERARRLTEELVRLEVLWYPDVAMVEKMIAKAISEAEREAMDTQMAEDRARRGF